MESAALIVPLVAGQSVMSILAGQYISWRKRYGEVMWSGFFLWALGAGLKCTFNRNTKPWAISLILLIEGCGVGNVFQPSMWFLSMVRWSQLTGSPIAIVAVQAHSTKADRAIIISVRNFLRSLGGACGLAISATVLANVLQTRMDAAIPDDIQDANGIFNSPYDVPNLSALTPTQREGALNAYMAASRAVFILMVPLMGLCLVGCLFVKDNGLKRPEESSSGKDSQGPSTLMESVPPTRGGDPEEQQVDSGEK